MGGLVSIRGMEVNGKQVAFSRNENDHFNKKVSHEDSVNLSEDHLVNNDSPLIPLGAVHVDTSSPLSRFLLIPNYILLISLLSLLLLLLILISAGVCRYMRRHKGESYYTQEDAGDLQAGDADTAVVQARTGPRVERRREWIL